MDSLGEEGESDSGDDDDVDGSGRSTTSITAMENMLLQPVLEILNKISSMRWSLPFYYKYDGKKYLIKR
jgi:hypothetical protein